MEEDGAASVPALGFELGSSFLAVLRGVPGSAEAQLMGPDHAEGAVPRCELAGPLGS